MSVECLLDTNVLVYAAAGRENENDKRLRALELINTREFGLSVQVLQEFYVVVTAKIATPLAPAEALDWIEQFEAFPCVATDTSLLKIAAEISARYTLSYWDAATLAAAQALDAEVVYSEDLNHSQTYDTVMVINPFL